MKALKLTLAALVLSAIGFQANAAVVTECGTNVCFTYDNSTLYGAGTVVGNNIFFQNIDNFEASSTDGTGSEIVTDTVDITIEAFTPNYDMTQFLLVEQGDYLINGDGASVTAGARMDITSLDNTCPVGIFDFICTDHDTVDAGALTAQGVTTDWDLIAQVDLADTTGWGSDTRVVMKLQNTLTASTTETGETAFIQKKLGGVGIQVVPVPAAVWLFGSALVGLGAWTRRRKLVA